MNKLVLHPSASGSASDKLSVFASAQLLGDTLKLDYRVKAVGGGPLLIWPHNPSPHGSLSIGQRRDELWQSTCLEAFIRFDDDHYIELNFTPQGHWNAYVFDAYRKGMRQVNELNEISEFSCEKQEGAYELSVAVDLSGVLKSRQHFRLGLTAVIETEGGERSYWSLKHAGDKPDFHDSRGHILEFSTRP